MLKTLIQLKVHNSILIFPVSKYSIPKYDKTREGSIDSNLSFQLIVWDVCVLKLFFKIVVGKLIEWHLGYDRTIGDFT